MAFAYLSESGSARAADNQLHSERGRITMNRIAIMLCLATLIAIGIGDVQAQPMQTPLSPYNRVLLPVPIPQTPWLNNQLLMQNFNLTNDQFNTLTRAYGNAWTSNQNNVNGHGINLPQQQEAQQIRELKNDFYWQYLANRNPNNAFAANAARIRNEQLDLQRRGDDALVDPAIQARLNLSQDQRQRIEKLQQQWQANTEELNRRDAADRESVTKQLEALRMKERKAITDILTAEQRTTWNQMIGEPYDFSTSAYLPITPKAAAKKP
jgi:hypothetical protein